jgi:superfamily II DNA or RNA helicase
MNYNENEIVIVPISAFQKTIADNISSEGIGIWDGNTLNIKHYNVYNIDYSRLGLLGIPALFSGHMIVKMQGTPNMPNCRFILQFTNEFGRMIVGENIVGSILKISRNETYLLSQQQYEICEKINKAHQTNDEFDRWSVIVMSKNANAQIKFEGLPSKDSVKTIDQVEIDLIQNPDGSLTLDPKLDEIKQQTRMSYDARLNDELRDGVVVTEVDSGSSRRYIAPKNILQSVKRIREKNHIKREDVSKFLENPQSFLLNNEESESDISINTGSYRIIGIGEPYVGYFGSIKLDSPIAKALLREHDPVFEQQINEKIESSINNKTTEEIKEFKEKIKYAIENNQESFEFADEEFFEPEYPMIEKMLNRVSDAIKENEENISKKGVIKILPNDEIDIVFDVPLNTRKELNLIETKNSTKGTLFANLKYPPKKYQVEGVNWLIDLCNSGYKGGILADDMGLGKTYQVISFMNYLFYQKQITGRILIVAPTILIENWRAEMHKFLINQSKFRVKILRGNDLTYRSDLKSKENKNYNYFDPELLLQVEGHPTVFITTYQTMSNYQFSFAEVDKFKFDCIVYDEAHNVKNPSAQISQAAAALSSKIPFSILLTGTPIENELRDLWALFDIFDPTHFGSWKTFKKEFVDSSETGIDVKLRQKASNYILRRLKKEYLTDLPPKLDVVREVTLDKTDENDYMQIVNSGQPALTRLHQLRSFSIHKLLTGKNKNSLTSLDINKELFESYIKIRSLLELLEDIKQRNEKVIIFVINQLGQDILKYGIQNHFGVNVDVINGTNNNQANVKRKLDAFKLKDGFGAIILSPLAAGVGLTITEANHVIHYERWWNASKEDQASDRVYRIGQEKNVYIHYIIGKLSTGKKSIDEAIHELICNRRETSGFLVPPVLINENEMARDLFNQ